MLEHPHLANLDCRSCERYVVNEVTGKLDTGRNGLPVPRLLDCGPSFLAPCRDRQRGCPKGTPEQPNSLSPANQLCLQHYFECAATGSFPDDSVVSRNAAVIQQVRETLLQRQFARFQSLTEKMNSQR